MSSRALNTTGRSLTITTTLLFAAVALCADPAPRPPIASAAAVMLDDKQGPDARNAVITANDDRAGELIAEMARGLGDDPVEEYRRIPWIWRVAVAAGKRNDAVQLKSVLEASLPAEDAPLHDWQSVVLGGGVINGLTQAGEWPRVRVEKIIGDDAALNRRWNQANEKSAALADNEKVNHGTRYDALRMIAMRDWERSGPQLRNYLAKGTHRELQMGAVSACGDIDDPRAAAALIEYLPGLDARNVPLAIDALKRTAERKHLLDEAVTAGQVPAALLKTK